MAGVLIAAEEAIAEAEPRGQLARDPDVGARFAAGRDRRAAKLDVTLARVRGTEARTWVAELSV